MSRSLWMSVVCLLAGLAGGVWYAEGGRPWQNASAQTTAVTAPTAATSNISPPRQAAPIPSDLTLDELRNIKVYETANRSVVNIDTTTVQGDGLFMMQREAEGSGSGAVIDQRGHIITNYHVIDGARKIDVTLASNATYPAELVGGDKEHDIAVLKIDAPAEELFPLALGRSDNLRVGQRVYALGNPFGWDGTMTTGSISSLNRDLPSRVQGRLMQALIQTDAAMNPGNSGGPLLDSNARMIGMCVAIASRTGQNTGIGFGIPIDRIKAIIPELIDHGHVVRADIGISHVMETEMGLVIARLAPEGPAAKAGLQGFKVVNRQRQFGGLAYNDRGIDRSQADRILAVDGERMRSGVQFRDKIWERRPGEVVKLAIVRQGRQLDVPVTLGSD